ncbi:phosphoribosylamine--glycine ligase [Pectinatus cerevisiiphilus]|uniref:Phosphoribosylamine--glycine ligase n=1 Tax=Pectinatus cerevisiiphilus TaxID=86956 RepID=A0A4V2US20_9FIRM|nr:phosphoribosylamine--glycine ligase [Pectinatus cerevisiiphilus]TCS79732.1 phosphoribosylamine--glycine ligase [Pectinatus cerevisiiphilus]
MDVLVIGSGGREHTLVWKLAQSSKAGKIYVLPGNPGMKDIAECVSDIDISDNNKIADFAKKNNIGLVVIGPEVPLMNGLVDALQKIGIPTFGPTMAAAQLEGSKSFSKKIMKKYAIPTAKYEIFHDAATAKEYIKKEGAPIVVKADGLAAGKGVIVAETVQQALDAIDEIMCDKAFGSAGDCVVVEEFLAGEEASVLAFTDGDTIIPMLAAQDHKRVFDGDKGPNTGGMGTYAPAPVVDDAMMKKVQKEVLEPIIAAMRKENRKYQGCLYAGLMITAAGPKVIEFNARFGDPETQVILPLLKSDLIEIMLSCTDGTLQKQNIIWDKKAAVCVVLASGGYPHQYKKGELINGIDEANAAGALVFHAGTMEKNGKIFTNGGRVLDVVATGEDIKEAIENTYKKVALINFNNMHFRHDIAQKAFRHLRK